MGLLDDFKGVLSDEEIAKIRGNAKIAAKIKLADDVNTYYYNGEDPDPAPNPDPDPPRREAAPSGDLASITASLQDITKKLGNVATKEDVETTIKTRGDELARNIRSQVLRQSDELNRIYRRHEKETGEEFDSDKFETWAAEQMKPVAEGGKGRQFASVTAAYEEWTGPARSEREIQNRVREELKKKASTNDGVPVPGYTPPSSKSPISVFMKRGKAADSTGNTAVDRAAEALNRIAAQKSAEA